MTELEVLNDRFSLALAGMGIVMNELRAIGRELERMNDEQR